jgi:hypothetical protein
MCGFSGVAVSVSLMIRSFFAGRKVSGQEVQVPWENFFWADQETRRRLKPDPRRSCSRNKALRVVLEFCSW